MSEFESHSGVLKLSQHISKQPKPDTRLAWHSLLVSPAFEAEPILNPAIPKQ